jgi:hypothetical protein
MDQRFFSDAVTLGCAYHCKEIDDFHGFLLMDCDGLFVFEITVS